MSVLIALAALALLMLAAYRGYSVILFAPIAALGAVLLTDPGAVGPTFTGLFMEKMVRALMIMCGQMRKPVLHDAGIHQPSSLDVADPTAEAGRGGEEQHRLWKAHCAFSNKHADQHQ